MLPIALQLYTIRDQIAQDFAAAMKQVAQIGYRGVELAGYGNLKSAIEARAALDDAGLVIAGNHVAFDAMQADLNRVLDDQEILGNRNLVVPWMAPAQKNAEGWRQMARSLERVAQGCRARGIELAYHNHSFEFERFDGKAAFDILWENSDPGLVRSELDVYWIAHGGENPVAYIERLGSRVLLLHLKDMAEGPERRFAEVGTGILDFPAILAAGKKAGVQWGVVEQDTTYQTPPMQAVRTSFENLRRMAVT